MVCSCPLLLSFTKRAVTAGCSFIRHQNLPCANYRYSTTTRAICYKEDVRKTDGKSQVKGSLSWPGKQHRRFISILAGGNYASVGSAGRKPSKVEQDEFENSSSSSSSSSSDEEEENPYPSPNDEEYGEYTGNQGEFLNEHMVQLTPLQRAIITVGSGLSAFFDPTKAENIATFGEISAGPVLRRLHRNMMDDPEGYRILTQKPRINSKTIDLDYLATLPEGTLGHAYIQFLKKNNVTPDSRLPVRFIEDPELAYVMQRYREVHDLVHTVTGQPTNMLGEVVVKWIEGIQTGLPMCVTGGLFGATRLRPKQRQNYINTHLKWAIQVGFTSRPFLYIFYEERWEQSLDDLRFQICPKLLTPPPIRNKQSK